ncbi:DUF5363 domain-containing protein [Testudinibacter sp. P80/BLE/0925]|uniref:DUF5363 domain-containing protein n=1 Tax=Testudinibacter sp. TW-1 TaxID=3417757 RepID=UPI003D3672E1
MTEAKSAPQKKSWFKRALDKYDAFCKEVGADQGGGCRRCVPIVRQDPELEKKTPPSENK